MPPKARVITWEVVQLTLLILISISKMSISAMDKQLEMCRSNFAKSIAKHMLFPYSIKSRPIVYKKVPTAKNRVPSSNLIRARGPTIKKGSTS